MRFAKTASNLYRGFGVEYAPLALGGWMLTGMLWKWRFHLWRE